MKYPKFLQDNGTIGFVAPSFGCSTEPYKSAFNHALDKFIGMGYRIELGPNCYAAEGIGISSTPEKCGDELTKYYCSRQNDVLISCGGGELMCGILDYLDFDLLKQAAPKWYMGYSDNTNFTFLLTTMLDTASIYGPCAAAFGMEPWHVAIHDAFQTICGKKLTVQGYPYWEKESLKDEEHPLVPFNTTEKTRYIIHNLNCEEDICRDNDCKQSDCDFFNIKLSGRLLGGCMDCLINLLGTGYDHVRKFNERYQSDGIIWFLEACDLNVMSIRRAIWQMEHAGWFQYVKGFIIGRPLHYGEEMMGLNQYTAITDLLSKYHVPIIMDVDLGHLPPAMPIICGSFANIKASEQHIEIEYVLK